MSDSPKVKEYQNGDLTVIWKPCNVYSFGEMLERSA